MRFEVSQGYIGLLQEAVCMGGAPMHPLLGEGGSAPRGLGAPTWGAAQLRLRWAISHM